MSYEIHRRFINHDNFEQFCFGDFETEQEAVNFYTKHLTPGDMEPSHKDVGVEYFIKHQKDKSYKLHLTN